MTASAIMFLAGAILQCTKYIVTALYIQSANEWGSGIVKEAVEATESGILDILSLCAFVAALGFLIEYSYNKYFKRKDRK